MPVLVKDYTWSETDTEIVITVPLKGMKPSKVDIFSSEDYVKVRLDLVWRGAAPRLTSLDLRLFIGKNGYLWLCRLMRALSINQSINQSAEKSGDNACRQCEHCWTYLSLYTRLWVSISNRL